MRDPCKPDSVEKGETKINNCIANSDVFISRDIKTSTKGKIFILRKKANWLISTNVRTIKKVL